MTSNTPPSGASDLDALLGVRLADRYVLERQVGSGSTTAIFEAADAKTGRIVTFKLMRPRLAAVPEFESGFDTEIRRAAELRHPNIAAIYDWGYTDVADTRSAFVVTERLTGGSLRDLFDRGRLLSPSQALAVGLDVCKALDHAHRRGNVHSELTPAKIVFGDDRRLRIVDFGLSRLIGSLMWLDPSNVPNHVAWYASPEQALAEPISGRTDVYSLSLVLTEAMTGGVPFKDGSTTATLNNRVGKLLPVSADMGPLASVLEHAARPDPEDRFSAAGFGKNLVHTATRLPRPEPLPLLSSGLFETAPERIREPSDPTGGVNRPGADVSAPAGRAAVVTSAPTRDPVSSRDGGRSIDPGFGPGADLGADDTDDDTFDGRPEFEDGSARPAGADFGDAGGNDTRRDGDSRGDGRDDEADGDDGDEAYEVEAIVVARSDDRYIDDDAIDEDEIDFEDGDEVDDVDDRYRDDDRYEDEDDDDRYEDVDGVDADRYDDEDEYDDAETDDDGDDDDAGPVQQRLYEVAVDARPDQLTGVVVESESESGADAGSDVDPDDADDFARADFARADLDDADLVEDVVTGVGDLVAGAAVGSAIERYADDEFDHQDDDDDDEPDADDDQDDDDRDNDDQDRRHDLDDDDAAFDDAEDEQIPEVGVIDLSGIDMTSAVAAEDLPTGVVPVIGVDEDDGMSTAVVPVIRADVDPTDALPHSAAAASGRGGSRGANYVDSGYSDFEAEDPGYGQLDYGDFGIDDFGGDRSVGGVPPAAVGYEGLEPDRQRRRRFPIKTMLGLLIIIGLIAVAVFAFRLLSTNRYVVPNLIGQPVDEAQQLIAPNGWDVTVNHERSDVQPQAGLIIRTSPPAGEEVAEGEPFEMVVSDGPVQRELPDLSGVEAGEAQARLQDLGMVVTVEKANDESVPAGFVIRWYVPNQDLQPGALVDPGTDVILVVSDGPVQREVPNLIGLPLEQARAGLAELGLTLAVDSEEFDANVPAGAVSAQSSPPGTLVDRDSEIRVVVSKGSTEVQFPDLTGVEGFEALKTTLEAAGFTVEFQLGDQNSTDLVYFIDGDVPETGAVYPVGTKVVVESR